MSISIVQMVRDVAGRPLRELRVVDLACLEGMYRIELARQGARVVAIEGREANLDKARPAQEALALDNLELYLDDVRNLSAKKYGRFDVVLATCTGAAWVLGIHCARASPWGDARRRGARGAWACVGAPSSQRSNRAGG
jgi:hypothetical protein